MHPSGFCSFICPVVVLDKHCWTAVPLLNYCVWLRGESQGCRDKGGTWPLSAPLSGLTAGADAEGRKGKSHHAATLFCLAVGSEQGASSKGRVGFPGGGLKWELASPSPWIATEMCFVEDTKMTFVIQEHFFFAGQCICRN